MGGSGLPDLLAAAASAAQQQNNNGQQNQSMTGFGPAPLIQPPPPVRFQPPQIQKPQAGNEFQTVSGNKRATKQAAFSAVAQTIKAGGDYITAKKTRTLQMQIEKLMEATGALDTAKQALQQNPNDPAAKEAVEHNTAIVNDLTKEPKINKQLQKAFNIDLFGNGKNKQENQALIAASKSYQEKQQQGDKTALNPVAQRLMQQRPQTMQINPQAQQQAMAIKAGLIPNAGEILKNTTTVLKMNMEAKTAEERIAGQEAAAQTLAEARKYGADQAVQAAITRSLGQKTAAEIVARSRNYSAQMNASTWDKRLTAMKDIAGMKTTNPVFKEMYETAGTYNTEYKRLTDENKNLQTEIDKKVKTGIAGKFGISSNAMSDADMNMARMTMQTNTIKMTQLKQQLDQTEQKMKQLTNLGMLNIGGGSNKDSEDEVVVDPTEVDSN